MMRQSHGRFGESGIILRHIKRTRQLRQLTREHGLGIKLLINSNKTDCCGHDKDESPRNKQDSMLLTCSHINHSDLSSRLTSHNGECQSRKEGGQ